MLKALSMVATVCLPASLVTVGNSKHPGDGAFPKLKEIEHFSVRLDSNHRFSLCPSSSILDICRNHSIIDACHDFLDRLYRVHNAKDRHWSLE